MKKIMKGKNLLKKQSTFLILAGLLILIVQTYLITTFPGSPASFEKDWLPVASIGIFIGIALIILGLISYATNTNFFWD